MSDLIGSEISFLRKTIIQAFSNLKAFSRFLRDNDFFENGVAPPETVVSSSSGFEDAVQDYILNTIIPQGLLEEFLKVLCGSRRIVVKIQALMEPSKISSEKWFRLFKQDDVAYRYCEDAHVFDYFKRFHPFTAELWSTVTDRKSQQVEHSKYFLAVITPRDLTDGDAPDCELFEFALKNWLESLANPEASKRFMLFYEKEEVLAWWKKWREKFRENNPTFDDKSIFIRELTNEPADRAAAKIELENFLNGSWDEGSSGTETKVPSNILVLGIPTVDTTNGRDTNSNNVKLFKYLRKYNPKRVQHWDNDWSATKRLTASQRNELFKYPPIFVRSASDKKATVAGLKDALIIPLINALGYADEDGYTDEDLVRIWRDTVGKFQRVYWRPHGEWWDGGEINQKIEHAWTGSAEDIGARLAKLAGFDEVVESKIRTRFEDLPDSDPNRNMLSAGLQDLSRTVVKQGEFDTVAVSLDGLDESVRRFGRAKLNIVAAHDQKTRPGDRQDTITHFENWDTRIDHLVGEYFPGREPKIFRIAVLFQNFDKFDGLRFDEGLSIRRWNLLKIKHENGKLVFNPGDLKHLKDAAKDMINQ